MAVPGLDPGINAATQTEARGQGDDADKPRSIPASRLAEGLVHRLKIKAGDGESWELPFILNGANH